MQGGEDLQESSEEKLYGQDQKGVAVCHFPVFSFLPICLL